MKLAFTVWLLLPFASAATLPQGTELQIRIKTKIASSTSKPKDPVEGIVIAPVVVGGQVIVPAGSTVRGQVRSALAAAKADEAALLHVDFTELADPSGAKSSLISQILSVDNARETVDEKGRILGILASQTISSRMDQGLQKLGERSAALADLLQTTKDVFVKKAEAEIVYEPGTELTLRLTEDAVWKGATDSGLAHVEEISDQSGLIRLVVSQAFQTRAEKPPKPSDVTNVMFIGSREEIAAAFTQAGWAAAAALGANSGLETFRAIAELRGYKEAPVSVLLLDGRKPDLVFQKQNNTFAQRHHLRIWRRPEQFHGADVWVCAATHDVGIDFSQQDRTFIHKIDPNIDRERAKVVNDLLFTGRAKGLALVDRPEVPRESRNATGDSLKTDGKMAVLAFASTDAPDRGLPK